MKYCSLTKADKQFLHQKSPLRQQWKKFGPVTLKPKSEEILDSTPEILLKWQMHQIQNGHSSISSQFPLHSSLNKIILLTFCAIFGNLFVLDINLTVFRIGPSTLRLMTSSVKTCLLHGLGYLWKMELPTWSHLNLERYTKWYL